MGFNVTVCLCVHFLFLLTVATKVWLLAVNPARRHSRSQMSCRSVEPSTESEIDRSKNLS